MGDYKDKEILRYLYRKIFSLLGLDKKHYWHATAEIEKSDIINSFPKSKEKIYLIENLASESSKINNKSILKDENSIKIIFISRISEKKNIKFILNSISELVGDITLDIYGMIGTDADKVYWKQCENIISKLKSNISVNYLGKISSDSVSETFRNYHLFFFPTYGENYGHVIAESLLNGCPVLLSDTTPWNSLEKYNAGWVYPLSDQDMFIKKLQEIVEMSNDEWVNLSIGASNAAQELIDNSKTIRKYIEFFEKV